MTTYITTACVLVILFLSVFVFCSSREVTLAEVDDLWEEYHEIRQRMHIAASLLLATIVVLICTLLSQ